MKQKSRSKRWYEAAASACKAFDALETAYDNLQDALQELQDVRGEYDDWKENLPENLQSSALAEKLVTVCDMDFEQDVKEMTYSELEELIQSAKDADLPLGFGRD